MNLTNRTLQILTVALFAAPISAYAESWSCSHDNLVREVHIERTTSAPAPCNVVYKKQTEGVEDQILWSANSDESYCEEKAQAFVTKLESWGWVCAETIQEETNSSSDAEEAPAAGDTNSAPAEENVAPANDADNTNTPAAPAAVTTQ